MNYKDPNYQDQIEKFLGDEFIDTYFDNVGGDILSFVLTKVKKFEMLLLVAHCRIQ